MSRMFRDTFHNLCLSAALLGLIHGAATAADENFMMVTFAPSKEPMTKSLNAKVFIDAPPAMVWDSITNYPHLKNILPGYEKCSVVKNTGNNKILDIAMKVAQFLPTYKYQVQVRENEPAMQISLNRISGDFKKLNATYKLIPQDNGRRTLLTYDLNIDTGLNIPGSQNILKSNTEKSMKALEKYVETEYRKSEIGQR